MKFNVQTTANLDCKNMQECNNKIEKEEKMITHKKYEDESCKTMNVLNKIKVIILNFLSTLLDLDRTSSSSSYRVTLERQPCLCSVIDLIESADVICTRLKVETDRRWTFV